MASARLKGDKWYFRITLTIGDGSHKYIERGGFKTKKEALDAGNRLEVQYKDGEDISRPKFMSFIFLHDEWLTNYTPNVYKKGTIQEYEKVFRVDISKALNDYNVTAITTTTLQTLINDYVRSGGSWSRLKEIRNVLSSIFKYAYKQGYVKANPMKDVVLPSKRSEAGKSLKVKEHTKYCPKEEIDAIFTRFPEGHPSYIPLILGYRCGLRIGEAFGVFVDDLDFKENMLHVRRQINYDHALNKYYFTSLKWQNPGEERIILLDKDTAGILSKHISKLLELSSTMRFPIYRMDQNGYLNTAVGTKIFPINLRFTDGSYIPPTAMEYVTHVIHGIMSKIDYVDPNWDFHSLRHTHASMCIASGMSPVSVQKRLGHKQLSTTYRYYVHETDTQVTAGKDILETMF